MNKQILKRFDLFKKVKGVKLDLEKVEFENINLVNDPSARILFNPPKDRIKVNKLIEEDALASKIPMDGVDEITGTIKLPIIEEKVKVLEDASYRYFENGDILWAKVTPCMENGNCAIVSNLENGIGYGSTEFHVFRADPNFVTKVYLWYYLRDRSLREKAKPSMTGSGGLKRVPRSFLENQYLPIPKPSQELTSIEIQKILVDFIQYDNSRWGNKLDKADELIAALEKLENAIVPKTLAKSPVAMRKFKKFLRMKKIDFDVEKLEFIEKNLNEISEIIMGQSPSGIEINDEKIGMPFNQGKSYFGKKYLEEPQKWTTNSKKEAKKGDILISMRAPAGVINIASYDTSIGRGLAAIRVNEDNQISYVYNCLKNNEKEILNDGEGGGIYTSITTDYVNNIKIKLPTNDLFLNEVSDFIDRYTSEIQHKKSCIYKSKTAIPAYNDAFIKILFASLKNIAHAE